MNRRGRNREKARARTSAWLSLVACAIAGSPALHAQTLPANRPTPLEQLRTVVGMEPAGVRPVAPRNAEPRRLGDVPAATTSVPKAPDPVVESRRPLRLDRVERIVDDLAILNRMTPPGSPPLIPVEALGTRPEIVPAVLEMPTPKPAPTEGAPSPNPEFAGDSASAVTPSSGLWEVVAVVLCLGLIGTFFVTAVFLVSRWAGLTVRLRVSLGSPAPSARAGI